MYNKPGKKHFNEPQWYKTIEKYEKSSFWRSSTQLISTLGPYAASWVGIVWLINHNFRWYYIIAAATIAAIFLVRIFIIFHDCTHHSFFNSRKANRFWGYITGLLTLTPYEKWQHSHNMHHNTYTDLDHRGVGDIWTMTVDEYINLPFIKRLPYRLYRNAFIMFILGPVYVFVLDHRFITKNSNYKIKLSVHFNNFAIAMFVGILIYLEISLIYVWIYLYLAVVAGALGIWLFYIQHQFEGVYWSRHENWDPMKAAFEGSSYYKLPKILQWLTGNIGLHPIHHLRVRIPNYNLQKCYDETPELHNIKKLSFFRSFKSLFLNLWDEKQSKLVSFHSIRKHLFKTRKN